MRVNYLLVLTNGQVAKKTSRLAGELKDDVRLILDDTCQTPIADMPTIDTDRRCSGVTAIGMNNTLYCLVMIESIRQYWKIVLLDRNVILSRHIPDILNPKLNSGNNINPATSMVPRETCKE